MTSIIGETLFTKTQQRVLGLLYGKSDKSFYFNEIVRNAAMGKGTIKRELEKLCAAGLVIASTRGNQSFYQANSENPIFTELKSIVQKTFGVGDLVKASIESLLPVIEIAFIYGSIAKGTERAESDIDLLVVSDELTYEAVIESLDVVEKQLNRPINPTLYTVKEFSKRMKAKQNFIQKVMEQPKIWIKGEES